MSYAAIDVSVHQGNPIELFEFFAENTYYRYAHYDVDVTANGQVWQAAIISRDRFSVGADLNRSAINIKLSVSVGVVDLFRNHYPEGAVKTTVYRTHIGALDELRPIWEGEITSYSFSGKQIVLKGEVPEVSLRSLGLRRMYQRSCPYPLYGPGCRLNKVNFSVPATISSVSGVDLVIDYGSCEVLSGGFLEATVNSHKKLRHIEYGAGNSIRLKQEADWLTIGLSIITYQGCARTIEACAGQFDNVDNFGGFHAMPVDNLYNTQVY